MVEIQGLAIGIAAGRAAQLEELFDLGMVDGQIDRRRAAPQGALADRECQGIHHPDERDDAAGLAVASDLLADRADISPVASDSATLCGQPYIFVPEVDDTLEAVVGFIQEAGDRKTSLRTAVR